MKQWAPRPLCTKVRRKYLVIPVLLITAALSSCVSTGENESPTGSGEGAPSAEPTSSDASGDSPEIPVIASSETSSTEFGVNLQLDIHSLKRQDNDTVVLDFSMKNKADTERITALTPPSRGDGAADFQPFSLIDGTNNKKHLPLLKSDDSCYCSDWQSPDIAPGEHIRGWIAFPAPPGAVDSMILTSAIAPPIFDIPITPTQGESKPVSGNLDTPVIWNLRTLEDDLASNTLREETGDEVAVSLSTDVLFAVGKSEIRNEEDSALKQVAQEIDSASGHTVKVEGHTDNTGNDSINDPLSLDRAEAVEKELRRLISKPEVTYKVEGHGSDDPISTNETKEGKQKNRRVTITFKK